MGNLRKVKRNTFTELWLGLRGIYRNCEAPGASNSEGLLITLRVEWQFEGTAASTQELWL